MTFTLKYCVGLLLFSLPVLLPGLEGGHQDLSIERDSGRNAPATARYYHGDRDGALAQLARMSEEYPSDIDAVLNYARLLREAGRFEESIKRYEELLERILVQTLDAPAEHSHAELQQRIGYEMGRALVLAGRFEEAVDHFQTTLADGIAQMIPQPDERLNRSVRNEKYFWYGTALRELGRHNEAKEVLGLLVASVGHHPQALLQLAGARLELADYEGAVQAYERALRQDANLTSALLPLARSYLALERRDTAYRLLQRAELSLPWNEDVRAKLSSLEDSYPELTETREAELAERTTTTRAPRITTLSSDREAIPTVRIGLAENVAALQARSGGAWILEEIRDGRAISAIRGNSEDLFTIQTYNENRLEVLNENDELLVRTSETLRIRYHEPERSTVLFDIEFGHGQFSSGREDRSYRGEIEFFRRGEGMTVVNTVNMEEYLYSVVPSEMPSHWPEAALQAQAIAARSYTIAGMNGRYRARGFDLLSSVASHYYRGISGEHPRTTAAVNATRGQVLRANGAVLNAVYSANTAGYTESSSSVWGSSTALIGVSDKMLPERTEPEAPEQLMRWLESTPPSYSNIEGLYSRSAYRWSIWVHKDDILNRNRNAGLGAVTAVTPLARGTSGRVEAVLITGTDGAEVVRRDAIRSRLGGLRSNLFMVEPKLGPDGQPEYFIFTGAGWGHGVGMCQTGAAGMASDGYKAEDILGHYYPRAELRLSY
ncbi:MAG: SpoIID/LytB domain-containing protein [Spirochaetaceae bacterium]|nr:MAG: SpoIID/LytB domain-containing protein [Spirochaetaceae bacterium]